MASTAQAQPEPDVADPRDAALTELRGEIEKLRAEQAAMRVELEALQRKQAETPTVMPPPKDVVAPSFPLRPTVSVGLRYDNIFPPDPLQAYQDDPHLDGFRMRVRAGILRDDPQAAVIGEVRLTLGQQIDPTRGYVAVGDAFRTAPVGMDRFWTAFRPWADRSFFQITVGKMPQPFWRGDRRRWRSELTWDDDVSPIGITLDIELLEQDGVRVENTAGYFVLHDFEDLRFQGLTGPVSLIADQLRVRWTYLTGAFAFYDYENINTGLSAPSALSTGGVSTQPATNAFLLRDGVQTTNNQVSYGLGAAGFVRDAFRMVNPALQAHIPLPLDDIGKGSELFMMADYSHNLSVEDSRHGIGGTAGILTGDHDGGWIGPFALWFTYRVVEADAVLATLADSNLGQGSDYRGFEVGASYDATRDVVLSAGYFDYLGAPNIDGQWRRFMVDVRWDY